MAPEAKASHKAPPAKHRKRITPTPKTEAQRTPSSSSKSNAPSPSTLKRKSTISSRRLWRSNAPRAQHPWQKAARANAETEKATELQRVYALLCNVVRRNRNQHRSMGWWREMAGLRRGVGRLVRLQGELGGEVGFRKRGEQEEGSEGVRMRYRLAREAEVEMQKRALERFIRDVLLERCYVAFSSVVRDVQFAGLGVALMGISAGVAREVGLPVLVVQEEEGNVQVEVVRGESLRVTGVDRGEVVRREWRGGAAGSKIGVAAGIGGGGLGEGGEERRSVEERARGDGEMDEVQMEIGRTNPVIASLSRKEKKKKGKKSAIDDLFAGLV